ncbi:MAG: discoidin domain-containing protein, partial [Cytophagaceae bacterium]|nr:discoidin domain-containing protein [Cytophagaceae bacterium]
MRYLLLSLFLLFVFAVHIAKAQFPFQLNGAAVNTGPDTYRLTSATNNEFGAIWHKLRLNLDNPVNIQGQFNFGINDGTGADGICFVMQNSCLQAGTPGGGIGYRNMPGQSMAVEFDTYQNISGTGAELNNDPVFDHIAVEKNGDVTHDASADDITAPVQIDAVSANVETNTYYDFQITYDPGTTRFRVYFNGALRIDIFYNIKTNVFAGNSWVYWGFTSSTGGSFNDQYVRINSSLTTQALRDMTFCGNTVNVTLDPLTHLRGSNIATGNPSATSSNTSSFAFDGNMGSRWESAFSDPQWIYVDLVSPTDIDSVVLYWEAAYASGYQIQTSTDASAWTTVFTTATGDGGKDKIVFSATNVRYVRMYGTTRATPWGYSLWEFQVYGLPKYLWSPNNGTVSPNIYSSTVTLSPAATTTYSVIIPDACLGFSTFSATLTLDCSLPVALIDFSAKSVSQGVDLKWSTASEQNVSHFELWKSYDRIKYDLIGYVNAAHNSNTVLHYNYHDPENFSGVAYYKLESIDFDGSRESGGIRAVEKENKKPFVTANVFENETNLIVPGNPEWVEYSVTDMTGRTIYSAV